MTTTTLMRVWWNDYYAKGYDRRVTWLGREGVKVSDFAFPAWEAMEQALEFHGYGPARLVSTYNVRNIASSNRPSLHSFSGVAIDIDPNAYGNKFIRGTSWNFNYTLFTLKQVAAVLAIRTNSGVPAWRWGGDFGDYMHWQLDCSPEDIESGIDGATVAGGGGDIMPRALFEQMIRALFAADGEFQGDPEYWIGKIDTPDDPEWTDFFAAFTRMVTVNG